MQTTKHALTDEVRSMYVHRTAAILGITTFVASHRHDHNGIPVRRFAHRNERKHLRHSATDAAVILDRADRDFDTSLRAAIVAAEAV
jgi:hypothetical protein